MLLFRYDKAPQYKDKIYFPFTSSKSIKRPNLNFLADICKAKNYKCIYTKVKFLEASFLELYKHSEQDRQRKIILEKQLILNMN